MSRREKILALRDGEPLVFPSMLLCDFANLTDEVQRLESAGFRALHLDVMDGVFVPNFSYGMTIVKAFHQASDLPLDVHLMMTEPEKYIRQFCDAGADSITFHIEAVSDANAVIDQIQELGMAAGVAIDRDTPVSAIKDIATRCDLVLIMTIKAGFGGQKFVPELLGKLHEVRDLAGDKPVLQVDGGVNETTISQCVDAGAQWMVVGSGVFKHEDYAQAHKTLIAHLCSDKR
jgi:ribulose-phosphate 3-epimerase